MRQQNGVTYTVWQVVETAQLVRHRIASFNQQSQRYVKFKGDIPMVKPATVAADPECDRLFDEAAAAVAEAYRALVEAGIPAEDARELCCACMCAVSGRDSLTEEYDAAHRAAQNQMNPLVPAIVVIVIAALVFLAYHVA